MKRERTGGIGGQFLQLAKGNPQLSFRHKATHRGQRAWLLVIELEKPSVLSRCTLLLQLCEVWGM
eukprot:6085254-Alexandrium_andersonii.AAC.1